MRQEADRSRSYQAGVPLSALVAGAEHLGVQLQVDVLLVVPLQTLVVADDRHRHLVQYVGAGFT